MSDDADNSATYPPDPALFDRLSERLSNSGPSAAIEQLCEELREKGDLQPYFYARLMQKRVELGVPPFPTGPATELPPETHEPYEEAIRDAGREVGRAYLDRGEIGKAWAFYRLIGEVQPVRDALEAYQPGDDDDPYPIIEVAWQHGVFPEKGFDLVLDRNGVCSAITMVHSSDLSSNPPLRTYCIRRLVRALHEQLIERLRTDLTSRGAPPPAQARVSEMIKLRPDLFADDAYHIDVSHLSSVVQMAMHLPAGPELDLARELCEYGDRLSPSLKGDNDPPFDNTYADYKRYLDILAGNNTESSLDHFREKAKTGAATGYSYPAEVLVNLLVKLGRSAEALSIAREYLADNDDRQLTCPSIAELAKQVGDYAALTESARQKSDPVTFLAGLIAQRQGAR